MSSKLSSNTASLQSILEAVNNLPNGAEGDTNTSNATATAEEIFQGKTAYAQGRKLTGTFTINEELSIQDNLIAQITTALEGKVSGGEQATPEISIDSSSGLITATAGTKSSTYQLAFQTAKTITPGTVDQIAVSSGYYTGGNITVAGDSNLIAGNIKSGVSIFGVNGTLEEGNGSSGIVEYSENEDAIMTGNIGNYTNNRIEAIQPYAFYLQSLLTKVNFPQCSKMHSFYYNGVTNVGYTASGHQFDTCIKLVEAYFPKCQNIDYYAFNCCFKLTSVSFPVCTTIGADAFRHCSSLTSINFPACTTIRNYAFVQCKELTSVSFPACTSIGNGAFQLCQKLTSINFPACTSIGSDVFANCYELSSLTLGTSIVCTLSNSNAFSSTPYAGYSSYFSGTPWIYVPASLIEAYKSATNWVYFSNYFSTIESLEE